MGKTREFVTSQIFRTYSQKNRCEIKLLMVVSKVFLFVIVKIVNLQACQTHSPNFVKLPKGTFADITVSGVSQFFHTLFHSSYRKRMDDFNTNFHLDQPGGPPPPLVAPHGGPGGGMDDGSSQMPSQRQVQVIHCQINIIF